MVLPDYILETHQHSGRQLVTARTSWTTSLNLIDQARGSDPDAWKRLCEFYSPLVYAWAGRTPGEHIEPREIEP